MTNATMPDGLKMIDEHDQAPPGAKQRPGAV